MARTYRRRSEDQVVERRVAKQRTKAKRNSRQDVKSKLQHIDLNHIDDFDEFEDNDE
jgi:hypothetical protein